GRVDLSHFIGIAAVNETTMKVCRQVKAICIDLAAKINFVDGDHYDGLHTTPVGSAKIAKRLFNELQGVLIFHSVGKPPR
ncbi:MAG: hypothetical protein O2944_06835, partial [Proteobacteria bacterium]|nr:hypothetical protein [Pseudomonadota bacterium]